MDGHPGPPFTFKFHFMNTNTFVHEGVNPDGTFKNGKGGAIITTGAVRMSRGEGCGLKDCNCSPGIWLSIIEPIDGNGNVKGVMHEFNDLSELDDFLFSNPSIKAIL